MAQSHLIVGAGNMGGALLSSWIRTSLLAPRQLAILDPSPGVEAVYAIETGARHITDVSDIGRSIRTVLLAVKPQMFADVNQALADAITEGTTVVSIMAGISSAKLRNAFPHCTVVRAMPNTPAAIGEGITAYLADSDLPDDRIATLEALLGASGQVVRVATDDQLNAVTAISGSGPAYIFHVCEALANAAQSVGLESETAETLARATVIGAAELLQQSERSPRELREAVTSPGGTTQAALDVLMGQDGMSDLLRRAARAAFQRARDLSD